MEKNTKRQRNILDVQVSMFPSYSEPRPTKSVSLFDWLTLTNDKLKNSVNAVRNAETKEERKRIKSKLPAITPSGIFSYRELDKLVSHSGILSLDFDDCDPDKAKEILSNFSMIAYVGESVSGNGVFALIPILYPDNHKGHFLFMKEWIEKDTGLIVDKSCSDVCRLRGYSYDERPYVNLSCELLSLCKKEEEYKPVKSEKPVYNSGDIDDRRFNKLLEMIEGVSIDITQDRQDWVKIGIAISGKYGESGRSYFHRISRFYSKYKPLDTDKQYNSFMKMKNDVSISAIFYIAKSYGVVLN